MQNDWQCAHRSMAKYIFLKFTRFFKELVLTILIMFPSDTNIPEDHITINKNYNNRKRKQKTEYLIIEKYNIEKRKNSVKI